MADAGAESGTAPGSGLLADVVATVTGVDSDRLELRRGDGALVSVRRDRIVLVRDTGRPPGAGRQTDPVSLEWIAAAGWPAIETARLGSWLLRAAAGWTHRANSALVCGAPDGEPAAAVAACRDWYLVRGLTPLLSVPQVPAITALLEGTELVRGAVATGSPWTAAHPTMVLVARSADVLAGIDQLPTVRDSTAGVVRSPGTAVVLSGRPSGAWLADYRDAAIHPAAGAVLAGPPAPARVRFAEIPGAAGPVVAARGRAVTLDGWVGLTAVATAPERRGGGLGRAVVAALLTDGLRHGGVRSHLEVELSNTSALAFWSRLGYRRSHESLYYRWDGNG